MMPRPCSFLLLGAALCGACAPATRVQPSLSPADGTTRNVILFVGDGMGVSTVTATRIYSVGVDGELAMDRMPFTALSRTHTADYIVPDSSGTMSTMMTGEPCNSGVVGFLADTERGDFNGDGDGLRPWTVAELAKQAGMKVGIVSTARATHATPAACYAHANERNDEDGIALQSLPTDASYNARLADGLDILMGGGRRHFIDRAITDEEGSHGRRIDGRDLRQEFRDAGYTYIWNDTQHDALTPGDLPVLGLFERSHMEWEWDRGSDAGGEPSIVDMTTKSIELLNAASAGRDRGYFLMVESGRIDHAHHLTNAFRGLHDTEAFDKAVAAAIEAVDLRDTLIIVTADHSHVFNIGGYPLRPKSELGYELIESTPEYDTASADPRSFIFDVAYGQGDGFVSDRTDANGIPYTTLGYLNGPGGLRRGEEARPDPRSDDFPGIDGVTVPSGPTDPDYLQEAGIPLSSETHSGEDVAIYAIGRGAGAFRGTVRNAYIAEVMRNALGLRNHDPN
ncbi:MAG: alkaline phosphatase [Planctomycetota bacterium]